MSDERPADLPEKCPSCASRAGLFWTMTDFLCLTCHWTQRRTPPGPATQGGGQVDAGGGAK